MNSITKSFNKTRIKTSPIWKIEVSLFKDIVSSSVTLTEILIRLGLPNKGGNSKTLKNRAIQEGIDMSHISLGKGHFKGKILNIVKTSYDKILVKNSTYNRTHLKKRLISDKLLENKCSVCGQLPEWNNKPLVLQLDHINGISNDNRLENLRIICPHCHSQTENFAGKNKRKN